MIELVFDDATQSVHDTLSDEYWVLNVKKFTLDSALYVMDTLLSNANTPVIMIGDIYLNSFCVQLNPTNVVYDVLVLIDTDCGLFVNEAAVKDEA